jgi:disulfide bond formation protein DsbB
MTVADLNFLLSLGVVATQIGSAILLLAYLLPDTVPNARDILSATRRWGLMKIWALSCVSAVMTLVYSDVLGFEPCPLCWWQRIFLYPQVIILGLALWKEKYRDAAIDFSIVLSVLGAGVALYHHLLQIMPAGTLPCPATGPSCAQITFIEFGYVTFPMMALALFSLNIVVLLVLRSRS